MKDCIHGMAKILGVPPEQAYCDACNEIEREAAATNLNTMPGLRAENKRLLVALQRAAEIVDDWRNESEKRFEVQDLAEQAEKRNKAE